MSLADKVKGKLGLSPEASVLFSEDAEEHEAEVLRRFFKGKSPEDIPIEKYLKTEFSLTSYAPDGTEKTATLSSDTMKCGKCGAENKDVLSDFTIRDGLRTSDLLQFSSMVATVAWRINRNKIVKDMAERKLDEYAALKQLKALSLALEKEHMDLQDTFSSRIAVVCSKCRQQIGLLDVRISIRNDKISGEWEREVQWSEFDNLPSPPPEITTRICSRLGIHPSNFMEWVKCAWADQLKQKLQEWRSASRDFVLPPDMDYQLDSFFIEFASSGEEEAKKRKAQFHEALDYVVGEDLRELASGAY